MGVLIWTVKTQFHPWDSEWLLEPQNLLTNVIYANHLPGVVSPAHVFCSCSYSALQTVTFSQICILYRAPWSSQQMSTFRPLEPFSNGLNVMESQTRPTSEYQSLLNFWSWSSTCFLGQKPICNSLVSFGRKETEHF